MASKSQEVAGKSREVNDKLTECHKDFGKSDTQRLSTSADVIISRDGGVARQQSEGDM